MRARVVLYSLIVPALVAGTLFFTNPAVHLVHKVVALLARGIVQ